MSGYLLRGLAQPCPLQLGTRHGGPTSSIGRITQGLSRGSRGGVSSQYIHATGFRQIHIQDNKERMTILYHYHDILPMLGNTGLMAFCLQGLVQLFSELRSLGYEPDHLILLLATSSGEVHSLLSDCRSFVRVTVVSPSKLLRVIS